VSDKGGSAEQNIIGEALYRLIIVVERRSAIVPPGGLMLTLFLATAFVRRLTGGSGGDGGIVRPCGVDALIMIVLSRIHRGASVAFRNGLDFFSVPTRPICSCSR
jgi:hypothetical protein